MKAKTLDQAADPYCKDGDHAWYSEHIPFYPLWVRKCQICKKYDSVSMIQKLNSYVSQEVLKGQIEELNSHRSLIGSMKGGISETKDDVDWRIEELESQLTQKERE